MIDSSVVSGLISGVAIPMLALIFTVVLVVITLSGSLWVMYHMNTNMMPMSVHDMRNMP